MTENNTQKEKKVYEKYFGALAATEYLIKEKNGFRIDDKYIDNAVTILGGINQGDAVSDLLSNQEYVKSNPGAVPGAVKFFSEQAQYSLQQEKIGNLYSFFEKSIDKSVPSETKKKIEYLFNSLKDKPLGEVLKEVEEAKGTMNDLKEEENFESNKDYKKAKANFEKYAPFYFAYQSMQSTKVEFERYRAISKANNRGLEKIVETVKLPEPGKK